MSTLKITGNYTNPYEAAHKSLSTNQWFNQNDWEKMARSGDLDQYIDVLSKTDKITNISKFYTDYNYDFADNDTRLAALYNEVYADKTNKKWRTEYSYDDQGNIKLDDKGAPLQLQRLESDYEYYKRVIKQNNDRNYNKYLYDQEKERKDSQNWFVKAVSYIPGAITEVVSGLTQQIDDIVTFVASVGHGLEQGLQGKSFADTFVNTSASNKYRIFESVGLQDAIIDFERRYTQIRDLDGNYSGFGKYVGGVSRTLGQMIPAMIGSQALGSLSTAVGSASGVTNSIVKASSSLIFYSGVTSRNVKEIYEQLSADGTTPSSSAILANATLKSAFQWGVEVCLDKFLGGASAIDNLIFGRAAKASTGKTLTKAGLNRLITDFMHEGAEEVFQDFSDFYIDKAFSVLIDENFGELTDISWTSLMDSFIMGGLASLAGSSFRILTTKRETVDVKTDEQGNLITDKNGDVKVKKLNKLASWEYGLNFQSFTQNFITLQEQGDAMLKLYTSDSKAGQEYAAAFTEMYAAYRMLTSVYSSIGEERFAAANAILTKIDNLIKSGKFDSQSLKSSSMQIANMFADLQQNVVNTLVNKLEEANITSVAQIVERGDNISELGIDENVKSEIKKLFDGDTSITKVVLTNDGNDVVTTEGLLFVPINYAKNATGEMIYETVAEQTLVESIANGTYKGLPLDAITTLYKQVSGIDTATTTEAIYNLVFNDSFFKIVLSTANKDTYNFISSLQDIEKSVVGKDLRTTIYKNKISKVLTNMKKTLIEYLSNNAFANSEIDILTAADRRKIAAARWCKNLYQRVLNDKEYAKLTDSDWQVLNNRINSMPIQQNEKDTLLKNLHSGSSVIRKAAMNRIANTYQGIFTTKYDGKIYMPDTSIPNRTFNAFLQNNGLTIDTLLANNNDLDAIVAQLYGNATKENIIKYRQSQFMQACNDKYTFRYDKQGRLGVYEASTNTQVGFSVYNAQQDIILKGDNLSERTAIDISTKRNADVKKILNSNIDAATAAYLSIDDVISDPSLLSDQIAANIQLKYGEVNVENTFLYLRKYYIDTLKTTTVIALSDGTYAFGNIRPMLESLKPSVRNNLKITNKTQISDIINNLYLYGRLTDISIKLTDRNIVAEYDNGKNVIYVNKEVAKTGGDYLAFAFLHEFQHAIQAENRMNVGINSQWIDVTANTTRKNIIADVRKHRPELFDNVAKNSKEEARIVNDFVYFSSGESTALGIDASSVLDFYPTLVTYDTSGTNIRFPWGTKYNISNKVPLSLRSLAPLFTVDFNTDEERKYIAMATNLLKGLHSTKLSIQNTVFMNLVTETPTDFAYDLSRLFSVITEYDDVNFVAEELTKYIQNNSLNDKLKNSKLKTIETYRSRSEIYNLLQDTQQLSAGQYTVEELHDMYNSYSTDVEITETANKIFAALDKYCNNNDYNFSASAVAYKASWLMSMLFDTEYGKRRSLSDESGVSGWYLPTNTIMYDTRPYSSNVLATTILHEILHFLSQDIINVSANLRQKVASLFNRAKIALSYTNYYGLTNIYEFIAEYANSDFRHILNSADLLSEYETIVKDILDSASMMLRPYKSQTANLYNDVIASAINDLEYGNDPYAIVDQYIPYKVMQTTSQDGTLTNSIVDMRTGQIVYQNTDDGNVLHLSRTSTDDIIVYKRTSNGKSTVVVIPDKLQPFSSLGKNTNQSLKSREDSDAKLRLRIQDAAQQLYAKNNKLTKSDIIEALVKQYEFVDTSTISDIVNDTEFINTVKTKTKANQSVIDSSYDANSDFKALNDKSIEKELLVDKPTTRKKRYVSQKEFAGTNLEKFGYISKYKRTQLSPELRQFIVNSHEGIDTDLWTKVKSGKITTADVMDYLRDSNSIDDTTFKVINNSYFHNSKITTFAQLKDYVTNKTPQYYAMRGMIRSLDLGDALLSNTNPKLLENFVAIINKDSRLKKIYDKIVNNYNSYKGLSIDISEKYLRKLWMQYFDGSAQTAGYIAAIAKAGAINRWRITGEANSKIKSLDDTIRVGKEDSAVLGDVIEDKSARDAFEAIFYSSDREEKIEEIMKVAGPKYIKKLLSKGFTQSQATKKFSQKWEQLRDMTDTEFNRQYAKIVKNMSDEEINKIFAMQLTADSAGLNVNNLSDKEIDKLSDISSVVVPAANRPSNAIVNNIRSMLRTISSNLTKKDRARFIKANSDIFTEDLKLKPDVLYKTNAQGKQIYNDTDKLLPIEDRVRQLSKDVRAFSYSSTKALALKQKMDKQLTKLAQQNAKLVEQLGKSKSNYKAITYDIGNESITVNATQEIPTSLKKLLDYNFENVAKSHVQELLSGDKDHVRISIRRFIQDNAELLQSLTQADVNEIVNFYLNSEIIPSTNKARQYSAIQIALMSYLISGNTIGQFVLSEEQHKQLDERLNTIISVSATNTAVWADALKMLRPAEIIAQSLARSTGIEFSAEDVTDVINAIETKDIAKIQDAKNKLYNNALSKYNGDKKSFLSKLLAFERLAMLSSPGTWVRNIVSNKLVSTGNIISEKVGSMLTKLFPKKTFLRDKQYRIIGTKVDSATQQFIKQNFIDNGLLDLVRDGLSKYDTRKAIHSDYDANDAITTMITSSIVNKLFHDNSFDSSVLNKTQDFILKMLSDDKSINKSALRYFGKMLVEDNVDLSKGLSTQVLNTFADAYKLAASDFMHKSNFFNKLESLIQTKLGEKGYFMYKQVFPFAAASWNWFVEGLNYTPIGLAKSIIQFAKLENTIERIDIATQKGENTYSSRFAQYITTRNIGKGVIGSIGWAIGAALAAVGIADIDDEDDTYKLIIRLGGQKIAIDISNLFGTQGIMLGINMVGAFKNKNVVSAISDSLDAMFNDSTFSELFNTFRYSNSFGDWLINQPYAFLNTFIPNFVKTLSSIANKYNVKYSNGLLGKIEKLAVNAIPGLAYAFPKRVDPYTGENQVTYKLWFLTGLTNKLTPLKIYPYNVSEYEKEAIALGINKSELTGRYTINDEKITLNAKQKTAVNEFYGRLNKQDLDKFFSNKSEYKVWSNKKNEYVTLKYKQMDEEQKKTVIERIMSNNSKIAKIYALTSFKGYKYYASDEEYAALKKLRITNIYKSTTIKDGFIRT